MAQAPSEAIRNISVTYLHFSHSPCSPGWKCPAVHPLTSPQAQNRAREMWYANRNECRPKQCHSLELCALNLAFGDAVKISPPCEPPLCLNIPIQCNYNYSQDFKRCFNKLGYLKVITGFTLTNTFHYRGAHYEEGYTKEERKFNIAELSLCQLE